MVESYADPRVDEVHDEIAKYGVSIAPILPDRTPDLSKTGSGTCVRIGGRFFVATAAHVVQHDETSVFFIGTPVATNGVLNVINRGARGGGRHDDLDVAWLELHPRAAAVADRCFLDVGRMRTHSTGEGDDLLVFGAPARALRTSTDPDGTPVFTPHASWWLTRALTDPLDLREVPDLEKRMYLEWPRTRPGGTADATLHYPEAPGISGGGVWSVNSRAPSWRAENIQFVGIEYSWKPSGGVFRFLRAFQAQVWLEMVADDIPDLRPFIDPVIAAGRAAARLAQARCERER